jgi:hypothetical protein
MEKIVIINKKYILGALKFLPKKILSATLTNSVVWGIHEVFRQATANMQRGKGTSSSHQALRPSLTTTILYVNSSYTHRCFLQRDVRLGTRHGSYLELVKI